MAEGVQVPGAWQGEETGWALGARGGPEDKVSGSILVSSFRSLGEVVRLKTVEVVLRLRFLL